MCVANSFQKKHGQESCMRANEAAHALANKVMTEINLGHHTSYVNIAVVL